MATLVPAGHLIEIFSIDSVQDDSACARAFVGEDGLLHFSPGSSPFLVVILDDSGYARVDSNAIGKSKTVQLQPWGEIDGRYLVGKTGGDSREIDVYDLSDTPYDPEQPNVLFDLRDSTAVDGTFQILHVPPGKVGIGRHVSWYFAGHSAGALSNRCYAFVAPGKTVHVTLGGTGRPVVGRLILPPDIAAEDPVFGVCNLFRKTPPPPLPIPSDIKQEPLRRQQQWYDQFVGTPADAEYEKAKSENESLDDQYPLQIGPSGVFRIDDVTSGSYTLCADVYANAEHGPHKKGDLIARAELEVDVPEMRGGGSDEPLELGDIVVNPLPLFPRAGDLAPDFSVQTLDGDPLKLSDFRGKYVLLEFWATWCGPCIAETPDLKRIFNEFGNSRRLVMISLSEDDRPFEPGHYARSHAMAWHQGFIGPHSTVSKQYGVDSIPTIWLIGPDGNVIALLQHHESVRAAVAKALGAS